MSLAPPAFVDERGQPLPAHIQRVLRELLPRLRRTFPNLQDETVVTEVLEEAGRRVADAERRLGPLVDRLHGYAWVAIRSVAISRMRRAGGELNRPTLELKRVSDIILSSRVEIGSPEAIEREILLREIFAMLTPEERRVVLMKKAGFSSQEIAQRRGSSAAAVDMLYARVRAKIRAALQGAVSPSRVGPGRHGAREE